jgi:hypothetical protein
MNPRDRVWWRPSPETAIDHYGRLAEEARIRLRERPALLVDPSRRRDGRCVICRSSRPEFAVKHGDPFCSTRCARIWHDQLADSSSIGS